MQGGTKVGFWGVLILQLREERGLSQRKLADAASVNRSTLRRIEEGTARGDIDVIERLLGYMGYELEALDQQANAKNKQAMTELENDPVYRSAQAMSKLLQMDRSYFG